MSDKEMLARLTAELVTSYVGNHALSDSDLDQAIERLPKLIDKVHEALLRIVADASESETLHSRMFASEETAYGSPEHSPTPRDSSGLEATGIGQTIFDDYLICLEDGLHFKTLKRHLATHHNLTPDDYRRKWALGDDYPMAAPAYSASRANIAKRIGLGAGGRGSQPSIIRSRGTRGPKKVGGG